MKKPSISNPELTKLLNKGWKNHKRGKVSKGGFILAETTTSNGNQQVIAMLGTLHVCLLGCEGMAGHPVCQIQAQTSIAALRRLSHDIDALVKMREKRLQETKELLESLKTIIGEIEHGR